MAGEVDERLRLEAFKEARDKLRLDFSGRGQAKFLEKTISAATISRLRKSDEEQPSEKFDPSTQDRLIWGLQRNNQGTTLYAQLAGLIDQSVGDRDGILKNYMGEFSYFRYASKGTIKDIYYVKGRIKIGTDSAGDPIFEHWSHDYHEVEPEHTGFVFLFENRVYLAGVARGVMRLAICRTLTKHKSKGHIPGLIVSVRDDPNRAPFSARFIMVHDSNAELIAKLGDMSASGEMGPDGKPKLNGELEFVERTKAPYAWYLLTH